MGRWLRILLGPLPATVLLLPVLFAGGLGTLLALLVGLFEPSRSAADRWGSVTIALPLLAWISAAGVGVLALWAAVLAESPVVLRHGRARWWLAAGLIIGELAAGLWLWPFASGAHVYGPGTWAVWLGLLVGPLVLGLYYLAILVGR
jgi:hypothetical protein